MKNLLLPILVFVLACSKDEIDKERDTSTFTGLYDGYSWTSTEPNQGVNQASTNKNIYYIKDNEISYGFIEDFTGEDNDCDKFSTTLKEGANVYDGESIDVFYELNTPEMLMIIFSFPEYADEFDSMTFTADESTLYIEYNEYYNNENHIINEVFQIDDSFTWEDFQDFECPK